MRNFVLRKTFVMLPKVIAISNQKGGVGKTTTAVNFSAGLSARGYKVLLIDTDHQASCTVAFGLKREFDNRSIYAALVGLSPIQDCIIPTGYRNLDLIPSTPHLVGAEIEMVNFIDREYKLTEKLEPIKPLYDFIIIDCPPSLGIVPVNSLLAADSIIIPLQCEFFGIEGLELILGTLKIIQKRLKPSLYVEGILLTLHDAYNRVSTQILELMRENFGDLVFDTYIPRDPAFIDATAVQVPVILSKSPSKGADAYDRLILEFLEKYNLGKRKFN
ncbi:cobyrinic acid ac-diamide synthase [Leadbetterella byssophila DSM 17132]|uniref:Cobyrinic acid ac-diamide synthase n=2 Tax=Leadbetterella TaxID=319458 RepID=E4RTT0_LEAB4|nr:cobyrinic acid ac-diamide synthase [Leadbetterella byssophila DSM 17132]